MFDADDPRGETNANSVGESDVRRESQSDFQFAAGADGAVKVEEDATSTDVLSLGLDLAAVFTLEANERGQAHVEAPHHPPFCFLRIRLHTRALRQERVVGRKVTTADGILHRPNRAF